MPPDWRADEDSIIFPHQGGFRQVGDLWAQVLISFFFDTVAVAVRVGIVGLGGFNPVEIRSGQFRNLFRHRFGIARCGEINNQRFSRILSGSADNRQPFCLQQRVQLFPDCVCFPGADVPGHDIKQLVQLCGCYAQIQADAHVRAGHWFHTAYGREDGYGSQFAFIIGQNVPFKNICKKVFFQETFHDRGKFGIGSFRCIDGNAGDFRKNGAPAIVAAAFVLCGAGILSRGIGYASGLSFIQHGDECLQSPQASWKPAIGVGMH